MGAATVRFLGHATLVIDMDGVRVITDPLLRPWISGLIHRHPPTDPQQYAAVDAILISHLHHDHLDLPSLDRLPLQSPVIGPAGLSRVVRRGARRAVIELNAPAAFSLGRVRVIATRARHYGYRVPFGPLGGSLGFVIEGSRRVYFAGDTGWLPGLEALRPIDLALLPVGGWGPRLGPGHMDARQAVRALQDIRPAAAVPIHWGSLAPVGLHLRRWPYLTRPALEFEALARRLTPEIAVRVLLPGDAVTV